MRLNNQEGCSVQLGQGQGRLLTRLYSFPFADQESEGSFNGAIKRSRPKNKLDQSLIAVASVSTVCIGVTTP